MTKTYGVKIGTNHLLLIHDNENGKYEVELLRPYSDGEGSFPHFNIEMSEQEIKELKQLLDKHLR